MISIFLYVLMATGQQTSHPVLTVPQAERLVRIVAEQEGYSVSDKRYYFDRLLLPKGEGEPHPGYISFQLYHTSPHAPAEDALDYYAVDDGTGDVVEPNLCVRYDSPALDEQKLRLRLRPSKAREQIENEIGCDTLREKHIAPKLPVEP